MGIIHLQITCTLLKELFSENKSIDNPQLLIRHMKQKQNRSKGMAHVGKNKSDSSVSNRERVKRKMGIIWV